MVERHIIESGKRITYEGVFDAPGLFNVINTWANDKGYWPVEKSHTESVKPGGKFIEFLLDPVFKKYSDYCKGVYKIHVQMSNVKDVVLTQDGKKVKLKEGKVVIIIQAYLETDYEAKWEVKPVLYVLRTIFEKYVLTPFVSGYERTLRGDEFVPKNVKSKITSTIQVLMQDSEVSIKVSKALYELEALSEDVNVEAHTRSQLFNIVSLLEAV